MAAFPNPLRIEKCYQVYSPLVLLPMFRMLRSSSSQPTAPSIYRASFGVEYFSSPLFFPSFSLSFSNEIPKIKSKSVRFSFFQMFERWVEKNQGFQIRIQQSLAVLLLHEGFGFYSVVVFAIVKAFWCFLAQTFVHPKPVILELLCYFARFWSGRMWFM